MSSKHEQPGSSTRLSAEDAVVLAALQDNPPDPAGGTIEGLQRLRSCVAPDYSHPIHPGEVLMEEFIKPFELNTDELAADLGIESAHILRIVRGESPIDADMAKQLGRRFDNSQMFWLNLQRNYNYEHKSI